LVLTSAEVEEAFARFVEDAEPRLLRALVAAFGSEVGREATMDALAYAWEHWSRVAAMDNPVGYLFRVGQSRSRSYRRDRVLFPEVSPRDLPDVDPRLPAALGRLSPKQRAAVVLLFVEELSEREVAEALAISRGSVRTHAERGMAKLRGALGVTDGT
jgi:RNA polymerase sigma factor (sigma-70 family)